MAGMAVDGLVSGFNTTEMISQLMQLEAAPQTLLKGKVTKAESVVSALQALNSKLSSLADVGKTAATAASWQAVKASSTATSVTATATAGTPASSLSFTVERLAASQTSLSSSVTGLLDFFDAAVPATLTLVQGSGSTAKFTSVSLAGVTDLTGLAGAVNKAATGVTATVVNVGPGQSRLQLAGTATGVAGAFDLYGGTVDTAQLARPKPPVALMGRTTILDADSTGPGSTVATAAADAEILLWNQQRVTSSSNTFTGVVSGLTFTVSALEKDATKPVTVGVGRDDAAVTKLASDLVANLATVLSEVASRTRSTTTKGSDGRQLVTGGVLSGDSATRSVQQQLLSAASMPVGTVSPSSVGLVLGKDGTVTLDATKFAAALAADPAKVQSVVTGVAQRVGAVATSLSDPTTGSLSLKIQGQQSYVKNLNEQVDGWDDRLALRRTTLERTYAAMEVSLSKLNSQSAWLSSQIAQMNANASS